MVVLRPFCEVQLRHTEIDTRISTLFILLLGYPLATKAGIAALRLSRCSIRTLNRSMTNTWVTTLINVLFKLSLIKFLAGIAPTSQVRLTN